MRLKAATEHSLAKNKISAGIGYGDGRTLPVNDAAFHLRHLNDRLWLKADLSTLPNLSPLYPRKML
jgi:hypothetical protein